LALFALCETAAMAEGPTEFTQKDEERIIIIIKTS
jgi:hypothetical protein